MPFGRYTCGLQWHIVLGGGPWPDDPQGKGRFIGSNRPSNCSQTVSFMLPPGECKQRVGCTCHSDSPFAKLRLSLLLLLLLLWSTDVCNDVMCRIYHTVVLDDPYTDPPGLDSHIPQQSPQLTREQLDVRYILFLCHRLSTLLSCYDNSEITCSHQNCSNSSACAERLVTWCKFKIIKDLWE